MLPRFYQPDQPRSNEAASGGGLAFPPSPTRGVDDQFRADAVRETKFAEIVAGTFPAQPTILSTHSGRVAASAINATSIPIPKKRYEFQNATSNASDSAAEVIAISGQASDSPGTPHTASPRRANAATVAANKTIPTGRRTASGISHDLSSVNGQLGSSSFVTRYRR